MRARSRVVRFSNIRVFVKINTETPECRNLRQTRTKVMFSAPFSSADGLDLDSSWTRVGSARVHVPSNQDIGCRLKLRCTPKEGGRSGPAKELVSVSAVEAGPGVCTFDGRHAYTAKEAAWPAVRVVSYNILADIYAQTELSKTVLYPYCAPYALQLDYRQNLVKKELAGYNADILCLQEVDKGEGRS